MDAAVNRKCHVKSSMWERMIWGELEGATKIVEPRWFCFEVANWDVSAIGVFEHFRHFLGHKRGRLVK